MTAGVTGSSGLVGRWLVDALERRGGARRLPREPGPADLEGVEVVFHLAAQTVVSAALDDPVGTFEANAAGTWGLLEAAADAGVRRVVLASTDQVYGPSPPSPVAETAALAPEGPYAASKAAAELAARSWPGSPEVVVARLSNVYGGGDRHASRLVPGTLGSILDGRPPVIRGDGSAARDLLHVDDAVDALLLLADRGEPGEAYNVGSGSPVAVLDVVRAALRVAGSDLEPEVLGTTPPGEGGRRAVDTGRLRALGWEPRVELDEGLRRTLAWEREHRELAR